MNCSYTTLNVERRTLNAERQKSKVGRDCLGYCTSRRRARRGSRNGFYTKIAKAAKPVKAHRSRLVSVIKGKNRACLEIGCEPHTGLFVPFATLV
jgi:hypothetical protein